MTLSELARTLPNGFHDSLLLGFEVDYRTCRAVLRVEVDVSGYPAPDPVYREASILLIGLKFLIVNPPDCPYDLHDDRSVDAFQPDEARFPEKSALLKGDDSKLLSFFVGGWNNDIHIAADSAELKWVEVV